MPIGQESALRLSVLNESRNDWVHNTFRPADAGPGGLPRHALRGQWLYEPHKDFSLLANLHVRDLNGSARRSAPTSSSRAPATWCPVSTNARSPRTARTSRRSPPPAAACACAGASAPWRCTRSLATSTSRRYSRGDIDGGFGAVFAPPSGPGRDPVLVGDRRRHAQAPAVDAGVSARVQHAGTA